MGHRPGTQQDGIPSPQTAKDIQVSLVLRTEFCWNIWRGRWSKTSPKEKILGRQTLDFVLQVLDLLALFKEFFYNYSECEIIMVSSNRVLEASVKDRGFTYIETRICTWKTLFQEGKILVLPLTPENGKTLLHMDPTLSAVVRTMFRNPFQMMIIRTIGNKIREGDNRSACIVHDHTAASFLCVN